ncbi:MAG: hypothetical protein ACFFAE_08995 [Candidatus Hodarchaeota archaeon]
MDEEAILYDLGITRSQLLVSPMEVIKKIDEGFYFSDQNRGKIFYWKPNYYYIKKKGKKKKKVIKTMSFVINFWQNKERARTVAISAVPRETAIDTEFGRKVEEIYINLIKKLKPESILSLKDKEKNKDLLDENKRLKEELEQTKKKLRELEKKRGENKE